MYSLFLLPETGESQLLKSVISSMLALYIAFHVWFLIKFIILIFMTVRERGRKVAAEIMEPLVENSHLKSGWILTATGLQLLLLYLSHTLTGEGLSLLILHVCFFGPPQIVAILIRKMNNTDRVSEI